MDLLLSLTPIALVDSLSLIPVAVVPMVLLLGGPHPMAGPAAFMAGVVVTYLPFGLLLVFGLDEAFDVLAAHFSQWWNREPDLGETVLEIAVGLALITFGHRLCARRTRRREAEPRAAMGPVGAFGLGAALNVGGLWGALPYFAAVAQILKADPSPAHAVLALGYYNLVFILPLAAIPGVYLVAGQRAATWLEVVNGVVTRWGTRILVTAFIGLGFLLVIDGVGWLLGMPLFPVDEAARVQPASA